MLATDQPLTERMVLFWHNHFTSSFQKVRYPAALLRQNALFRREALGNFATLLKDVARDPAMLIYLDGMRSVARQPNENFARELLELFTLGEGHYSEADIKAAARAFTGWTVDRETGEFRSRDHEHDDGEKTFLGQTGRFDGEQIIAILLRHPRTAETIVEKLWREFVSLKPDPAEVKRLAASFRNGYEIKPLMRSILLSAAVPRSRQPRRADQVAGRADRRHRPCAGPAGAGEDAARAHDAGAGPDAVRSAQRQGLGRRRKLGHDLHAAAAPAIPAPHRRGDDGGVDGGRHDEPTGPTGAPSAASNCRPTTAACRWRRRARSRAAACALPATRPGSGRRSAGVDSTTLIRTLLPRAPIDTVDVSGTPGAAVAAAMLDTAYQLK